jgi:hypothetical protein
MSHGATETFCGRISSRASRLIPTRQGLARSVPLSGAVGRSQFGLLDLGAGYGDFSRFSAAREKSALDFNPELIGYWEDSVRPLIFSAEDGTRIMLELRRVLNPGGRLIIIQPNFRLEFRRYFDDYTHKTIYTDEGFCGLLGASGFTVVRSEPRFTPFTMKSRWPKAEWMVDLYLCLPFRPLAGQFLVIAEPSGKNPAGGPP